jgi:hypothetical protein
LPAAALADLDMEVVVVVVDTDHQHWENRQVAGWLLNQLQQYHWPQITLLQLVVVAQLVFTPAVWVQLATTPSLVALPLLVAALVADKINPAPLTKTVVVVDQAVAAVILLLEMVLQDLEHLVKDLLAALVMVVLTGPLVVAVELVELV